MPSEATQYPHYDWLIGNHCDELTPWIPLIAARFVVAMGTGLLAVVHNMFASSHLDQVTTQDTFQFLAAFMILMARCVFMRVYVRVYEAWFWALSC